MNQTKPRVPAHLTAEQAATAAAFDGIADTVANLEWSLAPSVKTGRIRRFWVGFNLYLDIDAVFSDEQTTDAELCDFCGSAFIAYFGNVDCHSKACPDTHCQREQRPCHRECYWSD